MLEGLLNSQPPWKLFFISYVHAACSAEITEGVMDTVADEAYSKRSLLYSFGQMYYKRHAKVFTTDKEVNTLMGSKTVVRGRPQFHIPLFFESTARTNSAHLRYFLITN